MATFDPSSSNPLVMDTTTERITKPDALILKHLFSVFLLFASILLLRYHWNRRRLYIMARQLHGPTAWPVIGSALWFLGSTESKRSAKRDRI